MSDRLDRLIGWRILPALRFLRAVELDHHEALRRFTLDRLDLAATDDIVAIERRQRSRNLLGIFLKACGVLYVDFRDDVTRRHLDLPRMNRRSESNADRDAYQHCQREFVVRFHGFIPPLCLCE